MTRWRPEHPWDARPKPGSGARADSTTVVEWCSVANVAKIDHSPDPAEHLGSRLEFETLISDLSSRFINLRS